MNDAEYITHFEAYLLSHKRVSHNTFCAYKKDLSQFLTYLHDYRLTHKSIARKISALKTFFFFLHRTYHVPNWGTHFVIPKLEKKLPSYLSEQEIELLFSFIDTDNSLLGLRNALMIYLLYVTGMRVSELVNLTISAIDLHNHTVLVQGKGDKQRILPLTQAMTIKITHYITTIYPQMIQSHKPTIDYLFPVIYNAQIKPITRQAFWIILKNICIRAGIKKSISPHLIRHSFATHLLQRGVNLRSLQLFLGHENISTVEVYTHLNKKHVRNIYDKKHPRS